jgi:uncharacterized protein involved in exopolysaccharide biosynthesis
MAQLSEFEQLPDSGQEIALMDLVRILLAGWKAILSSLVAALVLAVAVLHVVTFKYRAELKVTPAQTADSGLRAGSSGGLSGLASLAGINLPADRSAYSFQIFLESITSPMTAARVAQDQRLMIAIFPKEWDASTKRWMEPRGFSRSAKNAVKTIMGFPTKPWEAPDAARLMEYTAEHVDVVRDNKRPVAVLTFTHADPAVARRFLSALHAATDQIIRERSQERTQSNIDYLSAKLRTVEIADHRAALTQVLLEQERTQMLASSKIAFAAEPLGAASTGIWPSEPIPAIVLGAAALAGVLFGCVTVLVRAQQRK